HVVRVERELGRLRGGFLDRLLRLRRVLRRGLSRVDGLLGLGGVLRERRDGGAARQQDCCSERGSDTRAAHAWRPQRQVHNTSSVRKHVVRGDTLTYPDSHTNTCMTSFARSMPRGVSRMVSPSTASRPASTDGWRACPYRSKTSTPYRVPTAESETPRVSRNPMNSASAHASSVERTYRSAT